MQVMLDTMFGHRQEIMWMISLENWEAAAEYADPAICDVVTKNEDWIWTDLEAAMENPLFAMWNSTSYGNVAAAVVHGAKFPERHETIKTIKNLVLNYIQS